MSSKNVRYAIGIQVNDEEKERARKKTLSLKKKYGVTRNEVLKMIIVDFLDDEDIIETLITKGGLKKKPLRCRKIKKF